MIFHKINTLPLELCHKIYKISLQDHMANFHENWLEFHLNSAKKRTNYEILKHIDINIFITEFIRLDALSHNDRKTICEFQDAIFWRLTLLDFTLANEELLNNNNGEEYILMARSQRAELYKYRL